MKEWDLKIFKYLILAIFVLIVLGGSTRIMDAGLACPDWPLCFGDVIPDFHPQVYFEFLHRALAGLIGLVTIYLNIKIMRSSELGSGLKWLATFVLVLLMAQVVMGGLTVLLQLHEKVVALHLAMGTGFFALSLWVYLTLIYQKKFPGSESSKLARWPALILLAGVYGQILLGGLVASHYAALVCTDFPLCHGQFIPTLKGVIGLHVIHRLGAYVLTAIVIGYFIYVRRNVKCEEMRKWSLAALIVMLVQVGIGIANVLAFTPASLAILHLAVGTLLLAISVRLFRTASFLSST